MERPELREFKSRPADMVMADRGKYIAACLTICRSYIAAGRPNPCPQLASFPAGSRPIDSKKVDFSRVEIRHVPYLPCEPALAQTKARAM